MSRSFVLDVDAFDASLLLFWKELLVLITKSDMT